MLNSKQIWYYSSLYFFPNHYTVPTHFSQIGYSLHELLVFLADTTQGPDGANIYYSSKWSKRAVRIDVLDFASSRPWLSGNRIWTCMNDMLLRHNLLVLNRAINMFSKLFQYRITAYYLIPANVTNIQELLQTYAEKLLKHPVVLANVIFISFIEKNYFKFEFWLFANKQITEPELISFTEHKARLLVYSILIDAHDNWAWQMEYYKRLFLSLNPLIMPSVGSFICKPKNELSPLFIKLFNEEFSGYNLHDWCGRSGGYKPTVSVFLSDNQTQLTQIPNIYLTLSRSSLFFRTPGRAFELDYTRRGV